MTKTRSKRNGLTLHDAELFWTRVKKGAGDACWLWAGATTRNGYGQLYVRDWYDASGKRHIIWDKAHRRSWEIANGPIPDGLSLCHHCDNPPCVRPDHLFLGTATENAQDMVRKGRKRSVRGERNPNVRLTAEEVRAIRRRYASGETQLALAAAFGVAQGYLSRIVRRKSWVDV